MRKHVKTVQRSADFHPRGSTRLRRGSTSLRAAVRANRHVRRIGINPRQICVRLTGFGLFGFCLCPCGFRDPLHVLGLRGSWLSHKHLISESDRSVCHDSKLDESKPYHNRKGKTVTEGGRGAPAVAI